MEVTHCTAHTSAAISLSHSKAPTLPEQVLLMPSNNTEHPAVLFINQPTSIAVGELPHRDIAREMMIPVGSNVFISAGSTVLPVHNHW